MSSLITASANQCQSADTSGIQKVAVAERPPLSSQDGDDLNVRSRMVGASTMTATVVIDHDNQNDTEKCDASLSPGASSSSSSPSGEEIWSNRISADNQKGACSELLPVPQHDAVRYSTQTTTLYDRERQVDQLVKGFDKCMGQLTWELLLITGASGTGKTSLVETYVQPLALSRDGSFVSGKFDLLERSEQYYPFVTALSEFVQLILSRKQAPTARLWDIQRDLLPWKETIGLLVDLIPSINDLLTVSEMDSQGDGCCSGGVGATTTMRSHRNSKSAKSGTSGRRSRERLTHAFGQFLQVVCSPDHPLVLFLDDMQWAEPASLHLWAALAKRRIPGLVMIGACHDNDLSTCSHLSVILRELDANQLMITHIAVGNLSVSALSVMAADVFGMDEPQSDRLANILLTYTSGNMFFVHQFLRILIEEKLLYQRSKGKKKWSIDSEDRIRTVLGESQTAMSLLSVNLQNQEQPVRDVLIAASCLGADFAEYLLTTALGADVEGPLHLAASKGFIIESTTGGLWKFTHDQIQQSVYQMMQPQEREQLHLGIGRQLWKALSEEELGQYADIVVKQLRLGARLLTKDTEKEQMAWLLLRAVELAAESASFLTAQGYVSLALSLLAPRHWRDQYDLTLSLYNAAAEVAYSLGSFTRLDVLIHEILHHARTNKDKLRAKTVQIYALGSSNRLQEAINTGLETLQVYFRESFPTQPSGLGIWLELARTRRLLHHVTDEDLLSQAPMVDPEQLASMRIMCILVAYAVYGRPNLAPLIAMRLVRRSIGKGTSGMSSASFGFMAMLLCSNTTHDIELGIRCGKLALQLLDKYDAQEWLPRVYTFVYGFAFVYQGKLSDQLPALLLAHRVGLGGGDIEFSVLSGAMAISLGTASGCIDLLKLSTDASAFVALSEIHHQANMAQFLRPCLQYIQNLRGQCEAPSILDGDALDWKQAVQDAAATKNSTALTVLYFFRLLIASFFCSYEEAWHAAKKMWRDGNDSIPCYSRAEVLIHEGIAAVELSQSNGKTCCSVTKQICRILGVARANLKKLVRLGRNFASKASLLAAELSLLDGKTQRSLVQFDSAIALGKVSKSWSDVGLSCERAAIALQRCGRHDEARTYLEQSADAYERWGATAKVLDVRGRL